MGVCRFSDSHVPPFCDPALFCRGRDESRVDRRRAVETDQQARVVDPVHDRRADPVRIVDRREFAAGHGVHEAVAVPGGVGPRADYQAFVIQSQGLCPGRSRIVEDGELVLQPGASRDSRL